MRLDRKHAGIAPIQVVPTTAAALGFALVLSLVSPCRAEIDDGSADGAVHRADAEKTLKEKVGPFVNWTIISWPPVFPTYCAAPPDAELSALADNGELHKPEVLRAQVERLLMHDRSRALFDGFGAQWLGVGGLSARLLTRTFSPR